MPGKNQATDKYTVRQRYKILLKQKKPAINRLSFFKKRKRYKMWKERKLKCGYTKQSDECNCPVTRSWISCIDKYFNGCVLIHCSFSSI